MMVVCSTKSCSYKQSGFTSLIKVGDINSIKSSRSVNVLLSFEQPMFELSSLSSHCLKQKPIVLKKRVLFILCFYYDVMGYFSSFILMSLQVGNMKMYCFDGSIDCTLCQQPYFVQKCVA